MNKIYPALMFSGALLIAISAGCGEKTASGTEKAGPGEKRSAPPESAAPVVPQAEIEVEGVPVEEQPPLKNLLRVDGIMRRGNEYVVALNGQVVKAGEFLRLTVRGKNYILEVMDIASQRIRLKATTQGEKGAAPAPSPTPKAAR